MKYVLLIHESKITPKQIAQSLNKEWDISFDSEAIYICLINSKSDRNSHVWLQYCEDSDISEYEEEEKAIFFDIKSPKIALVNYRDDKVLKKVLEIISLNIYCYIDNDYGTILEGTEFMKKWSQDWSDDNATS